MVPCKNQQTALPRFKQVFSIGNNRLLTAGMDTALCFLPVSLYLVIVHSSAGMVPVREWLIISVGYRHFGLLNFERCKNYRHKKSDSE